MSVSPSSRWCATRIRAARRRRARRPAVRASAQPRAAATAQAEAEASTSGRHRGTPPPSGRASRRSRSAAMQCARAAAPSRERSAGSASEAVDRARERVRILRRHDERGLAVDRRLAESRRYWSSRRAGRRASPASSACGTPSFAYDGSANTSNDCSHGSTSRWSPGIHTRSSSPSSRTCASSAARCGPSPTITRPSRSRASCAIASSRNRWPFQLAQRRDDADERPVGREAGRDARRRAVPGREPLGAVDPGRHRGDPLRRESRSSSISCPAQRLAGGDDVARRAGVEPACRAILGHGAETWRVRTIAGGARKRAARERRRARSRSSCGC